MWKGEYLCTQQSLGNIFFSPDRNAGKINFWWVLLLRCFLCGDILQWSQFQRKFLSASAYAALHLRRLQWVYGRNDRCGIPDGFHCTHIELSESEIQLLSQREFIAFPQRYLWLIRWFGSWLLPCLGVQFSQTWLALLSNVCLATSFYQSLKTMSVFMPF